jgi:hypothetical protein
MAPRCFFKSLHETGGAGPISQISVAVTAHFLLSAVVIACLPEIHRQLGNRQNGRSLRSAHGRWPDLVVRRAASRGSLFAAAIPSGAGWAMTSGAALNAIVARWFDRDRPIAIALAFNGASGGGVLFRADVDRLDTIDRNSRPPRCVRRQHGRRWSDISASDSCQVPEAMGLAPDGDASHQAQARPKPRRTRIEIVRSRHFMTISAAFSLGLFAQIGCGPSGGASFAGAWH